MNVYPAQAAHCQYQDPTKSKPATIWAGIALLLALWSNAALGAPCMTQASAVAAPCQAVIID
jgi:hypothetical protein